MDDNFNTIYDKKHKPKGNAGYMGFDDLHILGADHGPKDIFRALPHQPAPLAPSHTTSDLYSGSQPGQSWEVPAINTTSRLAAPLQGRPTHESLRGSSMTNGS